MSNNPIKKLAGQTAIYGLSSILGRLLNYLMVPIYVRYFIPEEYGIVNEMYAYVSFLIVILTYGMETAFFRYRELHEDKEKVYSTALISISITSVFFIFCTLMFTGNIARLLEYPNNPEYVVWFVFIIALDALSAIPFAKLRAQNKAKRFAIIKLINIGTNIFFNLFFIVLCPYLQQYQNQGFQDFLHVIYNPAIGVGYIFISNLISSIVTIALLLPEYLTFRFAFDKKLWQQMIVYALPLLVVGLAGVTNETFSRILIKYLLPENMAMRELGIFGACYKVSIIMTIFIQAFRYASEPFFFAQAKKDDARTMYADVMKYFVIICSIIFLAVMLYIDIVKYFVGTKGSAYHEGLDVVPILLLANMFLGIFFNLSIWYKLTGQTRFGALLTVYGAIITVALNFWLIPLFSYHGSAWVTLICYFTMSLFSLVLGQKYYPIPYPIKRILIIIVVAAGLFLLNKYLNFNNNYLKYSISTLFLALYILFIAYIEKIKMSSLKNMLLFKK